MNAKEVTHNGVVYKSIIIACNELNFKESTIRSRMNRYKISFSAAANKTTRAKKKPVLAKVKTNHHETEHLGGSMLSANWLSKSFHVAA